MNTFSRFISFILLAATLAGCAGLSNRSATAPTTDRNPVTGSRGGSGSAN